MIRFKWFKTISSCWTFRLWLLVVPDLITILCILLAGPQSCPRSVCAPSSGRCLLFSVSRLLERQCHIPVTIDALILSCPLRHCRASLSPLSLLCGTITAFFSWLLNAVTACLHLDVSIVSSFRRRWLFHFRSLFLPCRCASMLVCLLVDSSL